MGGNLPLIFTHSITRRANNYFAGAVISPSFV